MKLYETTFYGLRMICGSHPKHGDLIAISSVINALDVDVEETYRAMVEDPMGFFEGSIHRLNINGEVIHFITEEKLYGWLFFNFPGHPKLKEFHEKCADIIHQEVHTPESFGITPN